MIVSSRGPRVIHRRRNKKSVQDTKLQKFGKKTKKRYGRKARTERGNKYMTNVLSFINEEETFYDRIIFDTRNYQLPDFDKIHILMQNGQDSFVSIMGTQVLNNSCKQEFLDNIKPNLAEAKFANLDTNRFFTWLKVTAKVKPDYENAEDVRQAFADLTKKQLIALQSIYKECPRLLAWQQKVINDPQFKFGEFCSLRVEDAKAWTKMADDNDLVDHFVRIHNVFEGDYDQSVDNFYWEISDYYYRAGDCGTCGKGFWKKEMVDFNQTSFEECEKCGHHKHCPSCVVKKLQANNSTTFCCDSSCNCFLNVIDIQGGIEFFKRELEISEDDIRGRLKKDFDSHVLTAYQEIPEKIALAPEKFAQFETQFNNLNSINAYQIASKLQDQIAALEPKITSLIKTMRLKTKFTALDASTNELVQSTISGENTTMLENCKNMQIPIRECLQNRPEDGEAELFGMTMDDILNMKLQRAKDALTSAYSLATECSICMTTSTRDDEKPLALHNSHLERDVCEWKYENNGWRSSEKRSNFRLPCFTCKDCFSNYLNFKKALGKPALKCPGMNCGCHLKEREIKSLVPAAYADYEASLMRYALKRVKNFRTCPNADCSASLVLDVDCNVERISCISCSWSFCPQCNDSPHEGMTCEEMRRTRHAERWGEAKDYMENETKQCPYCLAWIEKNGGCNHMTCHHCRGEFCWLCFGEWKTHNQCESKTVVVRRPFGELFPDWLSKPKKTLLPRFVVGKYVSFELDGRTKIGRVSHVKSLHPSISYLVEPLFGSFATHMNIQESLLRGYNQYVAPSVNFEDAAYASFLSGFDESEDVSTRESGKIEEAPPVVPVAKVQHPYCSFLSGFQSSDDEDDREFMLDFEDDSEQLPHFVTHPKQKSKFLGSLKNRRCDRATREKQREISDSDDESSGACPGNFWLESDVEEDSESDSDIPKSFLDGFWSSDEESSSINADWLFEDDSYGFSGYDEEVSSS